MKEAFITAFTMSLTASLTLFAFFLIILATGRNARGSDYGDLFRFLSGGFVVMFFVLFLLASIGSLFS